ncbi:MAG: hypothetical protein RBT80_19385 [Candidatus Vecturithrix sp.]|nr:hypothetical protein [Candidatus Vecturithrix sp.]
MMVISTRLLRARLNILLISEKNWKEENFDDIFLFLILNPWM